MKKNNKYVYLEHTADLRFRAYGKTVSECFSNAATALTSAMVDPETIEEKEERTITLEAEDFERLLHDFLSEILFMFETEGLLFKKFEVGVGDKRGNYLNARFVGEEYNPEKHKIKKEIKAVTYHEMKIKKENDLWVAEVLCDI